MIEISGANCLATWLREKPPEFACVLAARIALRMTPILTDALYADDQFRRAQIILPSFRSLAAANFAGAWPDRFGDIRQAARTASGIASDAMAETHNEGQMNVIHSVEAVSEEHFYIHDMESDRNAISVASHSVEAIISAVRVATEMVDAKRGIASVEAILESAIESANAAHWAVDGANGYQEFRLEADTDSDQENEVLPHISAFWKAVERDAIELSINSGKGGKPTALVEDLSRMALWPDGIPSWASRRWAGFKDALPPGEGWAVWIDWYEARLVGQLGNSLLEFGKVTIAEQVWEQGPAQANAAIANLIKSSEEPSDDKALHLPEERDYQAALSFAGEQREYVEEVARHLAARSIAVFYDGFEQAGLWGKDGTEVFHGVYAERATYVVMFISEAYATKAWTRHERRSALSRMLKEENEYILPVRFDDTPIPGLSDTILYLRADDYSPAELSVIVAQKFGISAFVGKASDVPPPRMTSPVGEVVFDYSNFNGRYVIGSGEAVFETMWSKASDRSIYVLDGPDSINGVAIVRGVSAVHEITNAKALDYTSRFRNPGIGQIVVLRNTNGFYAALQVLSIKDEMREDDMDELRFRYAIQTNGSDSFVRFRDILQV